MTKRLTERLDELHASAIYSTGFQEFGNSRYYNNLQALVAAFETDLRLTDAAREVIASHVIGLLKSRLFTEAAWRNYATSLTDPILPPLVITGLPRTGTTALHRLISRDPQFQGLQTWLIESPMPRPPTSTWPCHPEYIRCTASLTKLNRSNPGLAKAHPFSPDEVEECHGILFQHFATRAWLCTLDLPTYAAIATRHNVRESYERFANVLRLIGYREPNLRWVLKSPHHMAEIEELLDVFPKAFIVHTHRDPVLAIPSLVDLHDEVIRATPGGSSDPNILGRIRMTHWRDALVKIQSVKRQFPRQIFDVDHRDFVADPLGTVRSIYRHFGLPFSTTTETALCNYVATNDFSARRTKAPERRSSEINVDEIRDTFDDYRKEYNFDNP